MKKRLRSYGTILLIVLVFVAIFENTTTYATEIKDNSVENENTYVVSTEENNLPTEEQFNILDYIDVILFCIIILINIVLFSLYTIKNEKHKEIIYMKNKEIRELKMENAKLEKKTKNLEETVVTLKKWKSDAQLADSGINSKINNMS